MSDLLLRLSRQTGLPIFDLQRIIYTAPRRYKVFEIPKKNGGMREIAQPARELKVVQRAFVDMFLKDLPVHQAAMAYRPGLSIGDNARTHAGHGPILKLDFKNFFPSIRSEDWERYVRTVGILAAGDVRLSALLLFRQYPDQRVLRLSIGAPSSPIVSNLLMFEFDGLVTAEAERRRIRYTRYADDMTFSGQRIGMLKDMVSVVPEALKTVTYPKLQLNEAKTTFVTAAFRRVVTGVVLANDGTVGLGRDKKRLLRAQVHRASLGALTADELQELAGYLSFVNVVEPEFLARLRDRYGAPLIKRIQRAADVPVDTPKDDGS
jgi:hypothetical protein